MTVIEKAMSTGKVWEKGTAKRVYFNTLAEVASFLNCKVVDSVSGVTPAGFDGMIKDCSDKKAKSFYDVNAEVFHAGNGDIANAARNQNMKVKRI